MADQPNVLVLFTDQQRFDTIAAAGFDHMLTPNLDRLVRQGTRFTNAYTPNPVCVPARHNLITGLPARYHGYSSNNGHPMRADLPTLPRILSDAGYDTRAVGKMHFRPARRHNGFNKMELMEEIPPFREEDEYAMYLKSVGLGNIQNIHGVRNLLYMAPQRSLIPEEHHGSTWVGDRSVAFLRQNRGRRPFFLWSSWIAPHPPFDVPDTFADLYRGRDIPEPLASETPVSPYAQGSARHADCTDAGRSAHIRRMRELYYSAISLIDKNVGKILDALEEIGELDNTLVLFTSDHGEMLGDHGCFQKMLPYDSCSRIPMIARYPKAFEAGAARQEFVDLNDVLPTVLDTLGIEYPGGRELPGGSLLREDKDRTRHYMEFGAGAIRWVSMRDERYKFNYYYAGGREELFDLREDTGESVDLLYARSGDPEVRAAADRLREALCAHEAKWGLANYASHGGFLKLEPGTVSSRKNGQFPVFPSNVTDPDEKAALNDFGDEVIAAVAREDVVKLHELNLEDWQANGAPVETIERIRREKL